MRPDILKIIEYGIMAPSADNNQPWYFQIKGNSILIYLDKTRQTIKDFSNKDDLVDLISMGALLENMRISSLVLGYQPEIIYNQQLDNNLTATINLIKDKKTAHQLYEAIPYRTTNRQKYQKHIPIQEAIRQNILKIAKQRKAKIYFIDDKTRIQKLAKTISCFDDILWSNKEKRRDLLEVIRWTKQEAEEKQDGLPLEALELKKWEQKAFVLLNKLAKRLPLFFSILRLSSKNNSYKLVKSSPIVFVMTMPRASKADYLQGGQILENIWLYLTSKNISCQPMVGALFSLFYEFFPEGKDELTLRQKKTIEKINQDLQQYFQISKDNALIALCRIGYAQKPSLKIPRRPIQELIQA